MDQQGAHRVFDHPLHELISHHPDGYHEKAQDKGTAFFDFRVGQVI